MRILLVSPLPPPEGGIATWTKQYIEYCKENGIDICIVNIALIGERLKRINSKRNISDEVKRTIFIINDLSEKIKEFKPDYIHINSSCAKWGIYRDLLCVLIAKKHKCNVITHFRCTIQDRLENSLLRTNIFQLLVKASDIILTLNEDSTRFVESHVKSATVFTVPNFVNVKNIEKSFEVRHDVEQIVFVGHVQFDKGIREIFEAAAYFQKKKFILAGPISDEIKAVYCPPNVKMLGDVNHAEVFRLLVSSDVFLFPSYTEGFSNALAEAMACGLPCIASNVGANKDMLENVGGVIVESRDSKALIEAINYIENAAIRKKMSDWNIAKVSNKYSVESVMELLLTIYKTI